MNVINIRIHQQYEQMNIIIYAKENLDLTLLTSKKDVQIPLYSNLGSQVNTEMIFTMLKGQLQGDLQGELQGEDGRGIERTCIKVQQ